MTIWNQYRLTKRSVCAAVQNALLFSYFYSVGALASESINFYVIAPRGVPVAHELWTPIVKDLQSKARMKVNLVVAKDQKQVRDALINGEADMGYIGNVAALEVFEADKADVFVDAVRVGGYRGYHSIVVARRGSGIGSVEDISNPKPGLSISLGEEKSTSGYVVPNYYIWAKRGRAPDELFSKVLRGDHQTNLRRVISREVDLATTNDVEYEAMRKNQPENAEALQVVWKSNEIPESPLMWKRILAQGVKKKLLSFFTEYGKSDQQEKENLLRLNGLEGFVGATNARLQLISDIEMFAARTAVARTPNLTSEERTKRELAVIRRAVTLEQKLLRARSSPAL
jgi:phosphonate transport system substrate-binding protein